MFHGSFAPRRTEEEEKRWGKMPEYRSKPVFTKRKTVKRVEHKDPDEAKEEPPSSPMRIQKRPYRVTPYKYGTSDGHVGEGWVDRGPPRALPRRQRHRKHRDNYDEARRGSKPAKDNLIAKHCKKFVKRILGTGKQEEEDDDLFPPSDYYRHDHVEGMQIDFE